MVKSYLKHLLPFGLLFGAFVATNARAGISGTGQAWIYSCALSMGSSIGPAGFVVIAPSKKPASIIGSTANFVNLGMGCN